MPGTALHPVISRRTRASAALGLLSFLALTLALPLWAAPGPDDYPCIPALASSDPVFRQYSDDVEAARQALAAGRDAGTGERELPVHLYRYAVKPQDTLIAIAARCSIPYDSIASLNRLSSLQENLAGRTILLPTLPGLYLPDRAVSSFENILLSSFDPDDDSIIGMTIHEHPEGKQSLAVRRTVHLVPDTLFDGTVRSCFVSPSFTFPLPQGVLTSSFGMRKNPVTGHLIFHKGVDLAAPRGTPVRACADGTVQSTGFDPVYGNYVILRHAGSRESLYGHLSSVKIELHQRIKSGTILGTVGSSGQSTGPHLHFEIHENGVPKNPAGYIKGK